MSGPDSLPANGQLNQLDNSPELMRVLLPFVFLMRDARLSWAHREAVAAAMLECHRHWRSMDDERLMFEQASVGAQMGHSL